MGGLHGLANPKIERCAEGMLRALEQRRIRAAAGLRADAGHDADPGPRIGNHGLDVILLQDLVTWIIMKGLGVIEHLVAQAIACRVVVADRRLLELGARIVGIDALKGRQPRIGLQRHDSRGEQPFAAEKDGKEQAGREGVKSNAFHGAIPLVGENFYAQGR